MASNNNKSPIADDQTPPKDASSTSNGFAPFQYLARKSSTVANKLLSIDSLRGILLGLLSGMLIGLSFPSLSFSYFAFVGFVPLFIAIEKLPGAFPRYLAIQSFVISFYSYLMSWLEVFHPLALPGVLIYLTLVYYITFTAYHILKDKENPTGVYNPIFLSMLLCSLEFIRGVGFARFPYGNIAYSQYQFQSFIQIAEIVGYIGVSFYIYLANALIAQFFVHTHYFVKKWNLFEKTHPRYLKIAVGRFSLMAIIFIAIVSFGFTRINHFDNISKIKETDNTVQAPFSIFSDKKKQNDSQKSEDEIITYTLDTYEPITVRLVQPWFDYNMPWSHENKTLLYEKLTRLTEVEDANYALSNIDLIVWPESAILDYYEYRLENSSNTYSHAFKDFFEKFNQKNKTPFLVGSLALRNETVFNNNSPNNLPNGANPSQPASTFQNEPKAENTTTPRSAKDAKTSGIPNTVERKKYNASLFLKPNGEVASISGKIYLVPFAEYFPFKSLLDSLPWLQKILEEAQASSFSPFPQEKVFFDQNLVPFASMICYEDCFDDLASTYTLSGSKFLIVITNDAWSYSAKSQELHYMFSVFRAIENRRPILRVANAGVTGLVTASGELKHSLEMFVEGQTTFGFRPLSYKAFYTDLGITIASLLLLSFLILYLPYLIMKKTIKISVSSIWRTLSKKKSV